MNIPNYLTALRILLVPVFVVLFYLPYQWSFVATALVFALASFTDWLDGFLARYLGATSPLGTFLDPVADKLIVAFALVLIVGEKHLPLSAIPAAIIVGREIVISALREWMAEIGKRTSVAVSMVGKVKTAIQMLALLLLLLYQPGHHVWIGVLGYTLLYVAAGLTLWTMVMYIKTAWPDLVFDNQ